MRRVVATIVLALVTVIHGADTILCADGCADESWQEASTSTPGQDEASGCLLCQSSIAAGPDIPTAMPANVARAADAMRGPRFCTRPPSDIDQPPRLA